MAKEKEEKPAGDKKAPKKHLHRIVTEQAEDGSLVHHATYKKSKEDPREEPERRNSATSATAEEAGQHVAEQFGMNQGAGAQPEPGAGQPDPGAGSDEEAAPAQV
jgi:hypothetical protein